LQVQMKLGRSQLLVAGLVLVVQQVRVGWRARLLVTCHWVLYLPACPAAAARRAHVSARVKQGLVAGHASEPATTLQAV
jgi:hypothetical protein